MSVCLYVMYVRTYVCMYVFVYVRNVCNVCNVCMYVCMDVWMYGCMEVWMYVCMYCMYVCNVVYVCM